MKFPLLKNKRMYTIKSPVESVLMSFYTSLEMERSNLSLHSETRKLEVRASPTLVDQELLPIVSKFALTSEKINLIEKN